MTTRSHDAVVTLREITAESLPAILKLAVADDQTAFVASNAVSIAQAYFSPEAWFRGVYAGDDPVGFVMLSDKPDQPEYYLWRFMIDQRYQRTGLGAKAIALLVDHVRTRPNATELLTSVVPKPGGPRPFYESLGFKATGEIDEGEVVLSLEL